MISMQKIDSDIKEAMKAKEVEKLSTLRMLKAAILNEAIQKKKNDLESAEILDIIQKQVKQRRESIESFKSAGRQELAAKEELELGILQSYLPKQLTEAEIRELVQKIMTETGSSTKADMGKLMKALTPHTKGRADGRIVSEIVAQNLK